MRDAYWEAEERAAERDDRLREIAGLLAEIPCDDSVTVRSETYSAELAEEQGYTDGRWFSGRRRPGCVKGSDANYDRGFARGVVDKLDEDEHTTLGDLLIEIANLRAG